MAQTTYSLPNGQTITRNELTVDEVQGALHDVTLQLFGTAIPAAGQPDPTENPVRLSWQTTGAPDWPITQDMTFLQAVPDSLPQHLIRDLLTAQGSADAANVTQSYLRRWTATWTMYGPNATDRASQINALLLCDFSVQTLSAAGLGINPNFALPTRMPDLYDQQWWERSIFSATFLERVSFTITAGSVASVGFAVYAGDKPPVTEA